MNKIFLRLQQGQLQIFESAKIRAVNDVIHLEGWGIRQKVTLLHKLILFSNMGDNEAGRGQRWT